jgi:hypothetical protein
VISFFGRLFSALQATNIERKLHQRYGQALAQVFERMKGELDHDLVQQIFEAIEGSPTLIDRLNSLAESRRFNGLWVVGEKEAESNSSRGRSGWVVDGGIFLTNELLEQLKKSRDPNFDVVSDEDVYPNNTLFVIAHMAEHLVATPDMIDPRLSRSPEEWQMRALGHEAAAYIYGWNCVIEEATIRNGAPLKPGHIGATILLNLRYRFAILGAMRSGDKKLVLDSSGAVAPTKANIEAVSAVLAKSKMADIQ